MYFIMNYCYYACGGGTHASCSRCIFAQVMLPVFAFGMTPTVSYTTRGSSQEHHVMMPFAAFAACMYV